VSEEEEKEKKKRRDEIYSSCEKKEPDGCRSLKYICERFKCID
jgi:hypothetical protein